jgi:hypothetical protein
MTTNDAQDAPENNPDWMDVPTFVTNKEFEPFQTPKLTPEIVRAIRAEKKQPWKYLAYKYGVSETTIRTVKYRHTWRNVK